MLRPLSLLLTCHFRTAMLIPATAEAFQRFSYFAQTLRGSASVGGEKGEFPWIRLDDRLIVLATASSEGNAAEIVEWLRAHPLRAFEVTDVYEIVVAVLDVSWPGDVTIGRGVRLSPVQSVIATLAGLPAGWHTTQEFWLAQTLEAVKIGDSVEIAPLIATESNHTADAGTLINRWFGRGSNSSGRVLYLRAEAGKGKSTLLASVVRNRLLEGHDPLPIYLPLRTLQRDLGISWSEIAARLGVVGSNSQSLAAAVKSGLVAIALDGLDEVAGRYDPTVVQAVIRVISDELVGPESRIIISGRTTESALLDPARSRVVGIELPNPDTAAFREYAKIVVTNTAPRWPKDAKRVPEPPVAEEIPDIPIEPWQIDRIRDWIERIFPNLGKDRSLFFLQSLACIGRTYQLVGNKPLVIESGTSTQVADASLYDVCVLAAALACVREQTKIEENASNSFPPAGQLELLTWLALRAAGGEEVSRSLPSPEVLARIIFQLDPTHQYEEFTAVVRQMQKHALLFAGPGDGLRAGDWRPQFLSEWVRGALLCRAWQNADKAPAGIAPDAVEIGIATAVRSRIAFQYLFSELRSQGILRSPDTLLELLCSYADQDSPEAAANFWTLAAGTAEMGEFASVRAPQSIPPMADLSELSFDGMVLRREFSATLAVFSGGEFNGCALSEVSFDQCDFSAVSFVGCELVGVQFNNCDGPIYFEECSLVRCTFSETASRELPALDFDGCNFDSATRISQNSAVGDKAGYGPVAAFEDCEGDIHLATLISGDWTGIDTRRVDGYAVAGQASERDPSETCLRATLKPFFPRRAGEDAQLQARPYIRSSAVGRGRIPNGSPTGDDLIDILLSEGFTHGGREGHIYAPWSSVAGASERGGELRNELLAFLRHGTRGPTVSKLLTKIDKLANW